MSKKVATLVLVLMLLMTTVVYAVGPSKQTGDMTTATVVPAAGVTIASNFVVDTKGETEFSKTVFEELANVKVADYFPQEVLATLPVGITASNLEINEFMPLVVDNYDATYGEMTIAFEFPTPYTPGQAVVAVVGVDNGTEIEWVVLTCEVQADGSVAITFPAEVMEQVTSGDAVLMILNETAE